MLPALVRKTAAGRLTSSTAHDGDNMTQRESSTPAGFPATSPLGRNLIMRLVAFGESAERHVRRALDAANPRMANQGNTAERLEAISKHLTAALSMLDGANGMIQPVAGDRFSITDAGRAALSSGLEPIGAIVARVQLVDLCAGDDQRPYGAASSTRQFAGVVTEDTTVTYYARRSQIDSTCENCDQPAERHPIELHTQDGGKTRKLVCLPDHARAAAPTVSRFLELDGRERRAVSAHLQAAIDLERET
jgi:hypothetical protein